MKPSDLLQTGALGALVGASAKVSGILDQVMDPRALATIREYFTERLNASVEAGMLSRSDAGRVAPDLLRTLSALGTTASEQATWVARRFLMPSLLQVFLRPDPMDLALAMAGLRGAAREAASTAAALERRLRLLRAPLGLALGGAAEEPDEPVWTHVEDYPPAEPPRRLNVTEVALAIVWLAERIGAVVGHNVQRVGVEYCVDHGEPLASPQAVSAALAELHAVTGFTLWFAARLERAAWRAIGADS
jgi:hypothetical protein